MFLSPRLIGLHFVGPERLRQRLGGVQPIHLRRVVTTAFQQRRKTLRNSLRKLAREVCNGNTEAANDMFNGLPMESPLIVGDAQLLEEDSYFATRHLPDNWASKRPEELTCGQFVEVTRILYGPKDGRIDSSESLGGKVWRKVKHGSS